MAEISLRKNEGINLAKAAPRLKRIMVAIGWEPRDKANKSALDSYDLDLSTFVLKSDGPNAKNNRLISDKHMVFYGNEKSPDGAVVYSGDNRTGESTDGSEIKESVIIDLRKLPAEAFEISFVVTIYDAIARRQSFGAVSKAFIRIYDDETKTLVAAYNLTDEFSKETAVQFGSLYRIDNDWNFKAIGAGSTHSLADFVVQYGEQVKK